MVVISVTGRPSTNSYGAPWARSVRSSVPASSKMYRCSRVRMRSFTMLLLAMSALPGLLGRTRPTFVCSWKDQAGFETASKITMEVAAEHTTPNKRTGVGSCDWHLALALRRSEFNGICVAGDRPGGSPPREATLELYLLRHGIAAELGDNGVTRDEDRPLTDLGWDRMRREATGLVKLGLEID